MSKKRILIIDDEEGMVTVMKFNLETTGEYEVRTETDPLKTMDAVEQFSPDVIFLDLAMPGMSGDQLAYKIEKKPQTKKVAIIFLSGTLTEEEAMMRSFIEKNHSYLAKPVGLDDLLNCVHKCVQ